MALNHTHNQQNGVMAHIHVHLMICQTQWHIVTDITVVPKHQ